MNINNSKELYFKRDKLKQKIKDIKNNIIIYYYYNKEGYI